MLAWRKGFYGYFTAVLAFFFFIILIGEYYALSVLTPVMAEDLGWSAAEFGAGFSILSLLTGFSSPLIGAFIGRFGPRLSVVVGSLAMTAGMALMSITNSLWPFYLAAILVGVGMSMGAMLPLQQIIGNWFSRRRALILGLVMAGAGIGGLVVAPLTSTMIKSFDSWRIACHVLAVLPLAPALLTVLFIRNRPQDLGQTVDGLPQVTAAGIPTKNTPLDGAQWDTRSALKTSAFWLVALAYGATVIALQAVSAHQVAYMSMEAGLDVTLAASALGLMAGSSIVGRISAGWLGDRIPLRITMMGYLVLQGLGILILLLWHNVASIYLYVVLFGIGYGAMIILPPLVILTYFGPRNFAAIQGMMVPVGALMGTISPLLVGAIKDSNGSYVPGFAILVGACLLGALSALLAHPPTPRTVTRAVEASS